MKVRDLVERKAAKVITIAGASSIGTAVRLMLEHRVGGLPVLDGDGRLIGFLNERDIVSMLPAHSGDIRQLPVSEAMQRPPMCTLDEDIPAAMSRMTRDRHRHLVACEGDRVAGIISLGDIVKQRLEQLELETGVLRDYVAARRAVP